MQSQVDEFIRYCRLERRLVEPPDLRRFLAAETERRPAPSSQARTVAALKSFFRSCSRANTSTVIPRSYCGRRRSEKPSRDVLDRKELARLLRATEHAEVWRREHPGKRE